MSYQPFTEWFPNQQIGIITHPKVSMTKIKASFNTFRHNPVSYVGTGGKSGCVNTIRAHAALNSQV
jgi:hypothetical protein